MVKVDNTEARGRLGNVVQARTVVNFCLLTTRYNLLKSNNFFITSKLVNYTSRILFVVMR